MARIDYKTSPLNKDAGLYLKKARLVMPNEEDRLQVGFAERLTALVKLKIDGALLSTYETGARQVPGPVLIAAVMLSGLPLADPAGERTLDRRLEALEEQLQRQGAALEEIRTELRRAREIRLIGGGAPPPGPSGSPPVDPQP